MHVGILSPQADNFYDLFEFGFGVLGVLWAVFAGVRWIKDIREKDLKGIKLDVVTVTGEINKQTAIIADGFSNLQAATTRELQELRSDFRTFYTSPDPMMLPARARATRTRKSAAARSHAKMKPKTK